MACTSTKREKLPPLIERYFKISSKAAGLSTTSRRSCTNSSFPDE